MQLLGSGFSGKIIKDGRKKMSEKKQDEKDQGEKKQDEKEEQENSSTTKNDDDDDNVSSSSPVQSDDTLDDLLANMDIDKDFECWESSVYQPSSTGGGEGESSLNNSIDKKDEDKDDDDDEKATAPPSKENDASNGTTTDAIEVDPSGEVVVEAADPPTSSPSSENAEEQQDDDDNLVDQKWKERIEREEVYSHRYHPDAAERKELKELEAFLGMSPKRSLRTLFVRAESGGGNINITESDRTYWNLLIHPEEQQQPQQQGAKLFPSSILLKRGPVLYGEKEQVEGEAILLTHGLILAKAEAGSSSASNKQLVSRSFARAILWRHVTFVEPVAGDDMAWTLTLHNGSAANSDDKEKDATDADNKNVEQHLTFVCASRVQRDAWLDAMERVLMPHHRNVAGSGSSSAHHGFTTTELGWQYKLVHRPAYTMAVTGMVADMVLPPPEVLNKLDEYNGMTPLHYAVRLDMTTSIQRLLDAGADPNIKDEEGRTCMYYAVREKLPTTTISLLKEHGAEESKLAKLEEGGELFGRVQATESERTERREVEQREQAVAAQAKMNENMRLLQERGTKINDLGDKASDLNDNAANFADLAKQLKEKSKKQSRWLPF